MVHLFRDTSLAGSLAAEKLDGIKVLSFADEFYEDFVFWRSQEKIGERVTQRRCGNELRRGDTGSDSPQPRAEGGPDQFGVRGAEVLKQTLGDDGSEDEDMVCAEFALHGIAV